MTTATVTEMKAHFHSFVKASKRHPITVTRNAKPVAVLMAIEEQEDWERFQISRSPQFREIMAKSQRQIDRGEVLSSDQFWGEVEEEVKKRNGKSIRSAG